MAINYSNVASSVRRSGTSNIGETLSRVASQMPTKAENMQLQLQGIINKELEGLSNIYALDVDKWDEYALTNENTGMVNNTFKSPNAFEAYNNWKSTLDDRGKLDAQRAGINPLTFKAAFDAQKNMLLEGIGNKIKSYQIQKNADERTMRTVLGKNTQIQGYLNANFIDPDLNSYLTPKKNWAQSLGGVAKTVLPGFLTGEMDTGSAALSKMIAYPTAYGLGRKYGPSAISYAKNFLGVPESTTAKSVAEKAKNAFKGSTPKSTGPAGQQLNLFNKSGAPTKSSILKSLTSKLGKSRAISLLAKLPKNPYLMVASLVGMGLYNLVKNKDSYQEAVEGRYSDIYGEGAPDYTGMDPTQAFNKSMAAYKSKYGLK